MGARNVPDGFITISIADRLAELRRRLAAFDPPLGLPLSRKLPGEPDYEEVARLITADVGALGCRNGRPGANRMAVRQLGRELGLVPFADFQRSGGTALAMVVSPFAADEVLERTKIWAADVKRCGLRVPASVTRPGSPAFDLLSQELEVCRTRLCGRTSRSRAAIMLLAREVGFMPAADYAAAVNARLRADGRDALSDLHVGLPPSRLRRQEEEEARRRDIVLRHIKAHHLDAGHVLPESTRALGKPAYGRIFSEAGLHFRGVGTEGAIVSTIDVAARMVGVGKSAHRPPLAPCTTFGELLALGDIHYRLVRGSDAPPNAGRFRWAMTRLMATAGKTPADAFGDVVGGGDEMEAACIDTLPDIESSRQWHRAMRAWREVLGLIGQEEEEELPPGFGAALQHLRRRSAHRSLRDLCRAAGAESRYQTIHDWAYKQVDPISADAALIGRLELALGAEPGSLLRRIDPAKMKARGLVPVSCRPASLSDPQVWKAVRPLLPSDFSSRDAGERETIGAALAAEYRGTTAYRIRMQSAAGNRWRMTRLPSRLQQEWDDLVRYKTAVIPRHPRLSQWKPGTVDRIHNVVIEIFSYMRLPVAQGGLGVPEEHLSLCHLGLSSVVERFFAWKEARSPDGLDTGTRTWIGFIANLTTAAAHGEKRQVNRGAPVPGYLHHLAQNARNLRPIKGLFSAQEIAVFADPDGWGAELQRCNSLCWMLFNNTRHGWVFARDPFEAILPILQMDRPLDVLIDMLGRMYRDLPSPAMVNPFERAVAVRRYVAALIFIRTALRRRNVASLTCNAHGTGTFRRKDHGWTIELPAKAFKNEAGPFFARRADGVPAEPYRFSFPPEDTAIIDEYVGASRKVLLGGSDDHGGFFVTKGGSILAEETLAVEMHQHSWRYLVFHETTGTGIRGVTSFSVHAIRSITVTHILKVTGDYALAAHAIQDSVETIMRHYARFMAPDKTARVSAFLRGDLADVYAQVS